MIFFAFSGILATFLAYVAKNDKGRTSLFMCFFVMWFVASFQDCIGTDIIAYKEAFEKIMRGGMDFSFFRSDRDAIEIGWYLLNKGLGSLFGTFYAVMPVVYAVILYSVYKLLLYIPKQWMWVAVFFYYFGLKLFLFDMSGLRQGIAVAFWLLLVFSLKEKKYKASLVYALLGISFHNSFIFSIAFIPLIYIPYERIDFNRIGVKVAVFLAIIISFIVGYIYFPQLVDTQTTALVSAMSEYDESNVYTRYVMEMEGQQVRLSTMMFTFLLLIFVATAFVSSSKERKLPYENMFFVLYIISFLLESFLGGFGTLPRMFRYIGFFAIPAIGITAYRLKGVFRYSFIAYMALSTLYTFWASVHTEQFEAYLNYHTIFFQ